LRYADLEEALVDIMGVTPRKLSAFRAQLRHLRNIGVPRLPKSGSGYAIDYTREHAIELLLVLELQKLGQTARRAALVAGSIVRTNPNGQFGGKDCYVCVQPDRREYASAIGLDQLMGVIDAGPRACAVINYSACVSTLEKALNKVNTRR
jgi:hypothetical protein